MSFHLDDDKLLEKYKSISIMIENLKNIELNALTVYDDMHIKTKKRTYGDKLHTYFRGLNVPEDCIKCASFEIISIGSLLVYKNKYYLQEYPGNCVYKIVMIIYLDDNLFESNKNYF